MASNTDAKHLELVPHSERRSLWHYAFALCAVAIAFVLREGLEQLAGGDLSPFITFYPAVVIAALWMGFGPGLAATTAAALLAPLNSIPPREVYSVPTVADAVSLGLFVCVCVFLSSVAERLRRARNNLESSAADLARVNTNLRQEIASRHRAEMELSRERELLQLIYDNIPVVLVQWDPRLQRFSLNRHAEAVLGWTTADANEGDFMRKVYPDEPYRAEVSGYMQSLEQGWREWVATAKDGGRVPIDWANVPLTNDTMIGIGIDLRQRKEAEEALRRYKDELEERVRERTAALIHSESRLRKLSSRLLRAQEDERKRIAMDLHDSIAASLSAVKIRLDGLALRAGLEPDQVLAQIAGAVDLVQETNQNVRRLMADLRPALLDDLGVIAALRHHARRFQGFYPGIEVSVAAEPEESEVPERLRIVLFRIAQEALNNVAKHSGATEARIRLQKASGTLELEVRDNGRGFDRAGIRSGGSREAGFGLASMEERARLSGGELSIESSPGEGTVIRAYWDVSRMKED